MAKKRKLKKIMSKSFSSRKTFGDKAAETASRIFHVFDNKLTVMIVPHSQGKVVNFQTNVFAMVLGIISHRGDGVGGHKCPPAGRSAQDKREKNQIAKRKDSRNTIRKRGTPDRRNNRKRVPMKLDTLCCCCFRIAEQRITLPRQRLPRRL